MKQKILDNIFFIFCAVIILNFILTLILSLYNITTDEVAEQEKLCNSAGTVYHAASKTCKKVQP